MIRKISLAVLLICLTLPAMAVPLCHAAVLDPTPVTVTMAHQHIDMHRHMGASNADHRHQLVEQQHMCIGCIAPAKDAAIAPILPLLAELLSPPIIHELGDLNATPRLRPPQA